MAKRKSGAGKPKKMTGKSPRTLRAPASSRTPAKARKSRIAPEAALRRAQLARSNKERARREKKFKAWLRAGRKAGRRAGPKAGPGTDGRRPSGARSGDAVANELTFGAGVPGAAGSGTALPRILAEGDSWFDYPLDDGGVITHLETIARIEILNLAHRGDEVRSMLALEQRKRLTRYLSDDSYDFDALLFSGGGNDIVGDQFCLWLRPRITGMSWNNAIDTGRLDQIFGIVEIGYRELLALRDQLRPACRIFTHAYDYPKVTGKGVCGFGPWLKPSLEYRGWTDPADQFQIVRQMMLGLDAMMRRLETEQNAAGKPFTYVRTQTLLDPDTDWANEIHPNHQGFRKIARAFNNALAVAMPQQFVAVP